ncbi:hypothetical protein R6Q59_006230 [Mikania micrantha]
MIVAYKDKSSFRIASQLELDIRVSIIRSDIVAVSKGLFYRLTVPWGIYEDHDNLSSIYFKVFFDTIMDCCA